MRVQRIEEFTRGWFIGNFDPSIHKTSDFEVGVLTHTKGEVWAAHYHTGLEMNYLVSGQMLMHGQLIQQGNVFVMEPYEVADPEFLTDCVVLVIKIPSDPSDKYMAERSDRKLNDTV